MYRTCVHLRTYAHSPVLSTCTFVVHQSCPIKRQKRKNDWACTLPPVAVRRANTHQGSFHSYKLAKKSQRHLHDWEVYHPCSAGSLTWGERSRESDKSDAGPERFYRKHNGFLLGWATNTGLSKGVCSLLFIYLFFASGLFRNKTKKYCTDPSKNCSLFGWWLYSRNIHIWVRRCTFRFRWSISLFRQSAKENARNAAPQGSNRNWMNHSWSFRYSRSWWGVDVSVVRSELFSCRCERLWRGFFIE